MYTSIDISMYARIHRCIYLCLSIYIYFIQVNTCMSSVFSSVCLYCSKLLCTTLCSFKSVAPICRLDPIHSLAISFTGYFQVCFAKDSYTKKSSFANKPSQFVELKNWLPLHQPPPSPYPRFGCWYGCV